MLAGREGPRWSEEEEERMSYLLVVSPMYIALHTNLASVCRKDRPSLLTPSSLPSNATKLKTLSHRTAGSLPLASAELSVALPLCLSVVAVAAE